MYSIFAANKDKLLIKHLEENVLLSKNGFTLVGSANDGNTAYDRIIDLKPDIILADVHLPYMSGLELIKKVKERYPDIESVIISESAEFVYAQKAINCGVLGYCLKPFEDSELINVLKMAGRSADRSKKLIERDILAMLVGDPALQDAKNLENIFMSLGFKVNGYMSVAVLASVGDDAIEFPAEYKSVTVKIDSRQYVYFVNYSDRNALTAFLKTCESKGVSGIGIGGFLGSFEHLRNAVDRAKTASFGFFCTGKAGVFTYESENFDNFGEFSKHLEASCETKSAVVLQSLMDKIESSFISGRYQVKSSVMLYNMITSIIFRLNQDYSGVYVYSFEQLAEMYPSLHEMLEYFRNTIEKFYASYSSGKNGKCINKTFDTILKYVNSHCCENISLQLISTLFAINPSYVCQLFKKEVGMTFTEYLTKQRISFAIDMLRTTDMAIGEISEKVGYSDYFYFTRTFKKVTGKTPSQYRRLRVYN